MKRLLITCLLLSSLLILNAQPGALTAPLPEVLNGLDEAILVNHFPSPVHAVRIEEKNEAYYYWKHNTSVMAPYSDVQVESCGAYIFYNDKWNLRAEFSAQEFSRFFDCPKGKMKKGQPYTFVDNWRKDSRLYAGWALWYFIGTDENGERVMGYARLETTDQLVAEATVLLNH